MKRFLIILLVLSPVLASAQFYVSPKLGFSFNNFLDHGGNENSDLYSSYHMGISVGYETKILSFGLVLQSTGVRGAPRGNQLSPNNEKYGPSINPAIFIGKNFYFNGNYLAIDLQFGATKHSSDFAFRSSGNYWGYSFGASVTFNIKVTEKAFITIGTSPSYMMLPVESYMHLSSEYGKVINKNLTAIYIPLHVGATFKF